MNWLWQDFTRPRDIPQWAYQYLVVTLKADSDAVSQLKCVQQDSIEGGRPVALIRVFNPAGAGKGRVLEFASLDECPECILYEGYLDTGTGEVRIGRGAGLCA